MVKPFDPTACKVAVLRGGTSEERKVSLASGESVAAALKTVGFQVTVLDPAEKQDLIDLIEND